MSACVGEYDNCGSRSCFYVIDSERGFKDFESKECAEYAHYVQSKLAAYNLAPRVLSDIGKIRHRTDLELSGWGYITEIAETIGCGGNSCSCGDCDGDLSFMYQDKISKLVRKIEKLDVEFMDAHVGNVGYVKRNGKKVLVCIDCGSESVYDENCAVDPYEDDEEKCNCVACQIQRGEHE